MEFNLPEHAIWIVLMVVIILIVIFVYYFVFQGGGVQNLSKILGFLKIFG